MRKESQLKVDNKKKRLGEIEREREKCSKSEPKLTLLIYFSKIMKNLQEVDNERGREKE